MAKILVWIKKKNSLFTVREIVYMLYNPIYKEKENNLIISIELLGK